MVPSIRHKAILAFLVSFITSCFCVTNMPTETTCETYTMSISCPKGHLIEILAANYGRTNSGICPHANDVHRDCRAANSLEIVKESCDNRKSCGIQASNVIFGDPCPGTAKYLFVQYRCVEINPPKKTITPIQTHQTVNEYYQNLERNRDRNQDQIRDLNQDRNPVKESRTENYNWFNRDI